MGIELTITETKEKFDILNIRLLQDKINFYTVLSNLRIPEINSDKGIVINGRGPIWLYLRLYHEISQLGPKWIAAFAPLDGGAIVINPTSDQELIVPTEKLKPYISIPKTSMVIAFLGKPQRGKSVLLHTLFTKLMERNLAQMNENALIVKACPDGEGRWSAQIPQELVKEIRYKGVFDRQFVDSSLTQIKNCKMTKSLIFVDCGGKMDDYNRELLELCTHAIILGDSKEEIDAWKTCYPECKVLAEVISVLNHKEDKREIFSHIIDRERDKFNMILADLDRNNQHVEIPSKFLDFFVRR